MIIAVFGTPSPLTLWGTHVIRTMTSVALGECRFIEAVVIEDLRTHWNAGDNTNLIFYADTPDGAIARIFLELDAKIPIVIFIDEPSDVVGFSMAARQMSFFDAARFACQSFATLYDFFVAGHERIIRRRQIGDDACEAVALIARYCELELTTEQMHEVIRRLLPGSIEEKAFSLEEQIAQHVVHSTPPEAWVKNISSGDRRILDTLFPKREFGPFRRHWEPVAWPTEMFLTSPKGDPVGMPIQLTGAARFLIYGPYLFLPRGCWRATATFAVGENFSGNSMMVDVVSQKILVVGRFRLPPIGTYQFDIRFEVVDPRLPVELRFILEHGAIEGWFDLIGVVVQSDNLPRNIGSEENVAIKEGAASLTTRQSTNSFV